MKKLVALIAILMIVIPAAARAGAVKLGFINSIRSPAAAGAGSTSAIIGCPGAIIGSWA